MKSAAYLIRLAAFAGSVLVAWSAHSVAFAELSAEQEQALRKKAADRQRRIIFNNDGNEPVYLCKTADPEELLSYRTTPLANTQVDSVFYCTWSSGFSVFTHDTKIGQVFDLKKGVDPSGVNRYEHNVTRDLIDAGTDPLRIVAKFCREKNMEIFWSMRMNDTHDGSTSWYGPVMFSFNKFKNAHREWLIGRPDKKPKHGAWSAVDYAQPEIRDLAFRYIEEVCQNYDVDGVELDFFRHPVFFRSTASGRPATQQQQAMMTDLMKRIRRMAQTEGRKRERPLLIAVRVPDSVEFCQKIGIDLESWLQEGLVDLLVTSGYFQLNAWEYSVALGHKHGVKVYPSLDESRVRHPQAGPLRRTVEAYRGRAMNAWNAGADGVYLFNYADLFKTKYTLMRELGSPQTLAGLDKRYFASVRGLGWAAGGTWPHRSFTKIATLNPSHPLTLSPGKPVRVEFPIGEKLSASTRPTKMLLSLWFSGIGADDDVAVTFNGHALKANQIDGGRRAYPVSHSQLRRGVNQLETTLRTSGGNEAKLIDLHLDVKY